MHKDFKYTMSIDPLFGVYSKGYQYVVSTRLDERITRLEGEIKQKDQYIAYMRTEIAKLCCKHHID